MPSEFTTRRRIAFVETDMAGIVHFSNYFLFMEQTEHAFLRSLGLSVHTPTADGALGFPRVQAECAFNRPLHFEDEVEIHLRVRQRKARSIGYDFVFRNVSRDPPEEVARGATTVVCAIVGAEGGPVRSVPIPDAMAALIEPAPSS